MYNQKLLRSVTTTHMFPWRPAYLYFPTPVSISDTHMNIAIHFWKLGASIFVHKPLEMEINDCWDSASNVPNPRDWLNYTVAGTE